jgi:hypothetical protein
MNSIARVGGAIRIRAPQLATSQAAAGAFVGSVDHYIHDIKFGSPVPGIEVRLIYNMLQHAVR